jgi:hypothetical protein
VSHEAPPNHLFRPIGGDNLKVELGGGWWYNEED